MDKRDKKAKWFDNKTLIIILLFVVPPVGIIGMFLRDSKIWKKLIYLVIGLFMTFILLGVFVGLMFPVNYYENGNKLFLSHNYSKAINEYSKVDKDDKNYQNALEKIKKATSKIDSLKTLKIEAELLKEQIKNQELKKIVEFKNNWADSIVKDWKGAYIKSYMVSSNDTIAFQLTKEGSKGNWKNMSTIHESIYQKHYDSITNDKFIDVSKSAKIILIPDSKQRELNEEESQRQHLINRQFSSWDGSHRNLKKIVKENMNNPKTFEHVETTYTDKGSYLYVYMKFRGSNSFGAIVLNNIKAKVDLDGNILSTQQL